MESGENPTAPPKENKQPYWLSKLISQETVQQIKKGIPKSEDDWQLRRKSAVRDILATLVMNPEFTSNPTLRHLMSSFSMLFDNTTRNSIITYEEEDMKGLRWLSRTFELGIPRLRTKKPAKEPIIA